MKYKLATNVQTTVNPSGVKTGIFRENLVNTLAADALASCVAKSAASMLLTMQDK